MRRPAELAVRRPSSRERHFRAVSFSRDGKDRGFSLLRALAGVPGIPLSIAQSTPRTKIFAARSILQRLEDEKCIRRCILTVILAQRYFRALLEMLALRASPTGALSSAVSKKVAGLARGRKIMLQHALYLAL
jgi:hypothetical protein